MLQGLKTWTITSWMYIVVLRFHSHITAPRTTLRTGCSSSSVLTCRHHDKQTLWTLFWKHIRKKRPLNLFSFKMVVTSRQRKGKKAGRPLFSFHPDRTKSSRALCQNKGTTSKCNSAIRSWSLPCFAIALITVDEHMGTSPEVGFTIKKGAKFEMTVSRPYWAKLIWLLKKVAWRWVHVKTCLVARWENTSFPSSTLNVS